MKSWGFREREEGCGYGVGLRRKTTTRSLRLLLVLLAKVGVRGMRLSMGEATTLVPPANRTLSQEIGISAGFAGWVADWQSAGRNTETWLLGPQSSHGSVQKIDFNTKSHRSCT